MEVVFDNTKFFKIIIARINFFHCDRITHSARYFIYNNFLVLSSILLTLIALSYLQHK